MTKKMLWAGLLVLIGIIIAFQTWMIMQVKTKTDWNAWVNDVQMACQPGADEKTVVHMLGKPSRVSKPGEVMGSTVLRPRIPDIDGAERVLVYPGRWGVFRGFWMAFIFIDSNGKVLTYRFAYT